MGDLIAEFRQIAAECRDAKQSADLWDRAADTIEQQAARIRELEANIEWIGANTDSPSTALYCHAALEGEDDE